MKVNLLDVTQKVLFEEVSKPTKEEEKQWTENGGSGKLYYIIRGEDNEVVKYIDTKIVEEYNNKVNKKYKPKQVAEKLHEEKGIEVSN